MSLNEQLLADMKAAMKDKENGKKKLSVIRMVRSAIKNIEIDEKKTLNDAEIIEVLAREVKQRNDSIPEYIKGNREDIVEELNEEIEILMQYLPKQLTEDEIRQLVKDIVEEVGATSLRDMGKVMGKLMPKTKGRADGTLVSNIVKEFLAK